MSVVDVARAAGVALGTVSRVINRAPDVKPELRRKVLRASRELGFVPKIQHRAVGVMAGDLDSLSAAGFNAAMIALLAKHLANHEHTMELISFDDLELAYETHIAGIISFVPDERLGALTDIPDLPIISLNQPFSGLPIHSICSDHREQGRLATQHLMDHGHQRIGFIENARWNWGSRERLAGYESALAKNGIAYDEALVAYTREESLEGLLARLLTQRITSVLSFSSDCGLDISRLLGGRFGLRIPQGVSIIAAEHLPMFEYLTPPHTVVSQPLEDMVRLAADEMMRLIAPTTDSRRRPLLNLILPTSLIERESVAPPRVAAVYTP